MTRRLLCVDPDAEERAATVAALQEAGFAVTAAGTLDEARAALDERPDGLVIEASLPDGEGLELVAAARERNPDVGAILFTDAAYDDIHGDSHDEVVETIPKSGPNARETLTAVVETTIEERTQTDYPLPDDEDERLATLATYDLDDEVTVAALDRLTALAVSRFDVPRASINIVGEDEQRTLACAGLEPIDAPRSDSICTYTILDAGATEIGDVREDPRLDAEALFETFRIRAYAGARILTPEGHVIGTFCLYADEPRSFDAEELTDLKRFAAEAAEQLELRRRLTASDGSADVHIEPGGDA